MKLRIGQDYWAMAMAEKANWHQWFAWHPVCITPRYWVWLENVQRRRTAGIWEYEVEA